MLPADSECEESGSRRVVHRRNEFASTKPHLSFGARQHLYISCTGSDKTLNSGFHQIAIFSLQILQFLHSRRPE